MIPLNSASRRPPVRLTLRLMTCLLAVWSGAQGTPPGTVLNRDSGESRGVWPGSALASVPTALPASPFAYLHGTRPRPTARPDERMVFTLDGLTGRQNFTLRQLQALPTVRYATCQPQLKREAVYEGVPLRDLAALGGFAGRDVRVYASNGFVATIRAHDYLHEPIMLAYHVDGKPIPALTKGPLTVVLPRRPQRFFTPAYAATWVWFAVRLAPVP